jgi:membrane protease YdiL (CAAX protease family)
MIQEQNSTPESGAVKPERIPFIDRHSIHPLLFVSVVLCSIFLLYQLGGGLLSILFTGSSPFVLNNAGALRWAAVVGQILFILIPTLGFAKLLSNSFRDVFVFRIPSVMEATLGLLSLLTLQRVFEIYQELQDQMPVPNMLREFFEPLKRILEQTVRTIVHANSVPELIFVLFVVAVVPAVIEECLFRGLLQRTLDRLMSPVVSAVLTGMIFGLFHMNPFDIVTLVGLGIFMGMLRYRSQSLLLPISAHFLNNTMAVFAVYFGMDNDNLIAAVQPHQSIPLLMFQIIIFGGLFALVFAAYMRSTQHVLPPSSK